MPMPYRPLVDMGVEPHRPSGAQCKRCGNIPFRTIESTLFSSSIPFKCHVCGQPLRGGTFFIVLDLLSYAACAGVVALSLKFSAFIYSILDFPAHYFVAATGCFVVRLFFSRLQMRLGSFVRA
jgi:hypothetical protein